MTGARAARPAGLRYRVESNPTRSRWALRVWQDTGPGLFGWSDRHFAVFESAQAAHAARRRVFPTAEAAP